MEDNPYSKLLALVSEQAGKQIPITFRFGTVLSAAPLKIEVSNTVQSSSDLLKSNAIGELHSGDTILLIPFEENQRFLILCKVVEV
ncbi:DUF2577 family protein [Caproiciproducens sp.]|uniref:DUF2577 family protein n=1 Tax=Caproiciproducens sp. TaxID=1954376 RepID=UPI00289B59E5|nr:DUF2577 family protein [Caproiciproducens sp.]